ncbi:MerR family transcriptional regulator, partial [Paenibacillus sp. MMO-177]|uniref:MerR family transcriptional regulator n=1 Tax=Paenibacillus sp. MMO-177 TaxID=3081289 RepID=UPI0030184749
MVWLTVTELSGKLNIPDATVRRYVRQHGHRLQIRKQGKAYQVAENSLSVLTKIRELYSITGMTVERVEEALSAAHVPLVMTAETVTDHGDQLMINVPETLLQLEKIVNDRMNEMDEQMRDIGETLQFIGQLLQGQKEAAASAPALPDPEQQRRDRVNERMTERRIERQLRKEAFDAWNAKPEAERLKKVGWRKKEEDTAARDRFVID